MLRKNLDYGAHFEETQEYRVKLANLSEIEQFVQGLVPDPKFMYLHVIAMGAGEYYGCNRNGDYFPERALKAYHHTFEQNAKIFREHKNKSDSPSYGHVAKSWYNPEMHRVELVLAVDRSKAPDIVDKVEKKGEHPEVSMGCRVPHDVCSICGNKASKKPEYCKHIQYELKKVYPDGRQVSMLNLQPTFFDISFVFRRADKIAFSLKKVASEFDIGSTDHVFDCYDGYTTDWFDGTMKLASVTKSVPADTVVRVINEGFYNNILPKLEKIEPDLPTILLDKMALKYSIPDILSAFLRSAIPMKPREYTRIVIINQGLPMDMTGLIMKGIEATTIAPKLNPLAGARHVQDIDDMLAKFLPSRSSFAPYIIERIARLAHDPSCKYASYMPAHIMPTYPSSGEQAGPSPNYYYPLEPQYYNPTQAYSAKFIGNSSIPVQYAPEEYQQRMAMQQHQKLREPMNPLAVAALLSSLYAAYRGKEIVGEHLAKAPTAKTLAAGAAALGLAAFLKDKLEPTKTAGLVSSFGYNVAAPFIGLHMLSGHYRNSHQQGQQLNSAERFIAEYPDMLSVAAPFAISYAKRKLKKIAGAEYDRDDIDDSMTKYADFMDVIGQSVMGGLVFRGRGVSGAGSVLAQLPDNMLINHIANTALDKQSPPSTEPLPSNFEQSRYNSHREGVYHKVAESPSL